MMIPAAFVTGRYAVPNASFVTGFGAFWPTQPYDPPAVCDGTDVLNGTFRKPFDPPTGIFPRIVAGRKSSMNSPIAICTWTSAPAHAGSVVVPGATAALTINSTSGVFSYARANCCA